MFVFTSLPSDSVHATVQNYWYKTVRVKSRFKSSPRFPSYVTSMKSLCLSEPKLSHSKMGKECSSHRVIYVTIPLK